MDETIGCARYASVHKSCTSKDKNIKKDWIMYYLKNKVKILKNKMVIGWNKCLIIYESLDQSQWPKINSFLAGRLHWLGPGRNRFVWKTKLSSFDINKRVRYTQVLYAVLSSKNNSGRDEHTCIYIIVQMQSTRRDNKRARRVAYNNKISSSPFPRLQRRQQSGWYIR